jgi:hypothetical protein
VDMATACRAMQLSRIYRVALRSDKVWQEVFDHRPSRRYNPVEQSGEIPVNCGLF